METAQQINEAIWEHCKTWMMVLTGNQALPESHFPSQGPIKDRSVRRSDDRLTALNYLKYVLVNSPEGPQLPETQIEVQQFPYKHPRTGNTVQLANLIVTLPSSTGDTRTLLVGAHYDVQNSQSMCWHGSTDKYYCTQGADDNTSGVVGCLALVKLLAQDKSLPFTVKLAFFDGEEPGVFIERLGSGSRHLARELKEPLSYVMIIDMIGAAPTLPNCGLIWSASNEQVGQMTERLLRGTQDIMLSTVAMPSSNFDMNAIHLSDSLNFEENSPTVLVCNAGPVTPSFYHTERDTVEILDWTSFFQSIKLCHTVLYKYMEEYK